MESKTAHAEPLAGKLQRIEDLAEKLIYIKWSREFFVLLQRAAHDTLNPVSYTHLFSQRSPIIHHLMSYKAQDRELAIRKFVCAAWVSYLQGHLSLGQA